MAASRSKKNKRRADAKHVEKGQLEEGLLVVTFDLAKGGIVKVEALNTKGERQEISEKEFAELIGDDEAADLEAALNEAYAAGVEDASDDSIDGDLDDDEEAMLRGAEARRFLRRGARHLVMLRALRRGVSRKPVRPDHNGADNKSTH